jgi:methionine sulfoxide reductase heme-binding subunit
VTLLASGPNPLWFVARATGLVSLLLLTVVVVLGIITTGRWSSQLWPRSLFAGMHRNLSLLSIVFVAVHIAASILDPFARIQIRDAVVPYGAIYRPVWLGLGVVTIELAAAMIVTSLTRHFIGRSVWRAIHWTAYGLWPLALLHSLGTGSDSRAWWALGIEAGCTAAVVAAVFHRVRVAQVGWLGRRAISMVTLSGMVTLGLWAVDGPMQLNWARRAGTPIPVAAPRVAAVAPKPTPLAAAATGSVIATGSSTSLYLVASKDPSISVTVTPTLDGHGHELTVERDGWPVCKGPAVIGATSITSTCAAMLVTVTLAQSQDGSLLGTIKTSTPLP